jgi:glycosyltransferase involved in cell wall biosynthesis
MKVTLLMPVLNEIDGLKDTLSHLDRTLVSQALVVDGGSTDGSVEYARSQGCDIVRQTGKGIRQAYLDAFPLIQGAIVVAFSPDGNSDLERLNTAVEKVREGYDMVIVSRYKDWARSQDDTVMTALGNWVFTTLINLLCRSRITDALVMYRAYRKDLIPKIGLQERRSDWWETRIGRYVGWEPQMTVRAACQLGVRIAEIPGHEPPRLVGKTRIRHYRVALSCLYAVVQDWFQWTVVRRKQPSEVEAADIHRKVLPGE